jgi:hypothetical protein
LLDCSTDKRILQKEVYIKRGVLPSDKVSMYKTWGVDSKLEYNKGSNSLMFEVLVPNLKIKSEQLNQWETEFCISKFQKNPKDCNSAIGDIYAKTISMNSEGEDFPTSGFGPNIPVGSYGKYYVNLRGVLEEYYTPVDSTYSFNIDTRDAIISANILKGGSGINDRYSYNLYSPQKNKLLTSPEIMNYLSTIEIEVVVTKNTQAVEFISRRNDYPDVFYRFDNTKYIQSGFSNYNIPISSESLNYWSYDMWGPRFIEELKNPCLQETCSWKIKVPVEYWLLGEVEIQGIKYNKYDGGQTLNTEIVDMKPQLVLYSILETPGNIGHFTLNKKVSMEFTGLSQSNSDVTKYPRIGYYKINDVVYSVKIPNDTLTVEVELPISKYGTYEIFSHSVLPNGNQWGERGNGSIGTISYIPVDKQKPVITKFNFPEFIVEGQQSVSFELAHTDNTSTYYTPGLVGLKVYKNETTNIESILGYDHSSKRYYKYRYFKAEDKVECISDCPTDFKTNLDYYKNISINFKELDWNSGLDGKAINVSIGNSLNIGETYFVKVFVRDIFGNVSTQEKTFKFRSYAEYIEQFNAETRNYWVNYINLKTLYRFWSEKNKSHFYTSSEEEKNLIQRTYSITEWKYEGEAYKVKGCENLEMYPEISRVYRFWSEKNKRHFYTISESEKNHVIDAYDDIEWKYEGVAFCAMTTAHTQRTPVYRFWSEQQKGHFYTSSEEEKNQIIRQYSKEEWNYEGIAYYVTK